MSSGRDAQCRHRALVLHAAADAAAPGPAPAGLLLVRRPRVLVHVEAAAATMGPCVARSRAALPPAASCPAPRPRAERRAPRCSPPACSHARLAPAAPALTPPLAAARSAPPPADLRAPPPYPAAGRGGGAAVGWIWPGWVRRRRIGGELRTWREKRTRWEIFFYPNKACRRRQQAPCIVEWTVEIILDDVDGVVGRRPSGHQRIETQHYQIFNPSPRSKAQPN